VEKTIGGNMFILKIDLAYLEIHAGLIENKNNSYQSMYWRCLYTKQPIEFWDREFLVDNGSRIYKQIISRPYCSACNPEAPKYPCLKFSEVKEPVLANQLVESLL
jgi:hypothetical protein